MVDIMRTLLLTDNSDVVTTTKTSDIITGSYIYASNLPVSVKVLSITDDVSFIMDKKALCPVIPYTASVTAIITELKTWVYLEKLHMLEDVKNMVDEIGMLVEFIIRDETDISRDDYNGIKYRAQTHRYLFKAYPVLPSTEHNQQNVGGFREQHTYNMSVPAKNFLDNSIAPDDIDIKRTTVKIQGATFELTGKGIDSPLGNQFGYYTFELFKR